MDMVTHGVFGYFIVIILTVVVFLFLVVWTIKSVIAIEVTKRYELFRQQLQQEVSQTLDQFKKALDEEKQIFGAMMDCRSESLVRLYGIMIDIAKNGSILSKPGLDNLPFVIGLAQSVQVSAQEFFNEYQKNGIYFSDEFCAFMDQFMKKHEMTFAGITALFNSRIVNPQDELNVIMEIQKGWSVFDMDISMVITEMKHEFRRLVGPSSRW